MIKFGKKNLFWNLYKAQNNPLRTRGADTNRRWCWWMTAKKILWDFTGCEENIIRHRRTGLSLIMDVHVYIELKDELSLVYCGIWWPPHPTGMCGTRPFFGGSERRAVAHTHPAFPKMPAAPSAFLLLGGPQAPGDEPNPPKGVKAWREGPLRPKENSRYRDTLGQIRAADNSNSLGKDMNPIILPPAMDK